MNKPELYTSVLSAKAGDKVDLHISSEFSPCDIVVSRVGVEKSTVLTLGSIPTCLQTIPENASEKGCNWPVTTSFVISDNWQSGYYDIALTDAKQNTSHHFVVVRAVSPQSKAVIVLATNTYQAYNYWGGFNAYANVDALMSGKLDLANAMELAIGNLSSQRPFPQNIVHAPEGIPRLINHRKRAFNEPPFAIDPAMSEQTEFSPFDGSAGFVHKWEHQFVIWAEENQFSLDYLTDKDLNDEPDVLAGYNTVLFVGHSEYWSEKQRNSVDSFVQAGGNMCVFSGNTCYWKVRWENNGNTLVSHKWKGEENDPLWPDPKTRSKATHMWSHPEFGRPEAETIGLSFLYGGYHRLGNCAARGQAGFTVYDENHWSLKKTDLFYGDVFGDDVPLVGYESDGIPLQFDSTGKVIAGPGPGIPQDLEIIAAVPVTLGESVESDYQPVIPPEQLDVIARIRLGTDDPESCDAIRKGHAVIATFSSGKGRVFNAGTTEWVHGLAANNPFVSQITKNVLNEFGVLETE